MLPAQQISSSATFGRCGGAGLTRQATVADEAEGESVQRDDRADVERPLRMAGAAIRGECLERAPARLLASRGVAVDTGGIPDRGDADHVRWIRIRQPEP